MDRARPARFSEISTALQLMSDDRLAKALTTAPVNGRGIGGATFVLEVGAAEVFVKKIPLTDLELAHPRSTANLFDLPTFYQYGLGSTGFGAWRELATHVMTTNWALAGDYPGFPLAYHWRVLPGPAGGDYEDIDETVAYWDGDERIRRRLQAIEASDTSLVIFLEHFPALADRTAERQLLEGAAFMRSRGLVHFDAHFHNIMSDGEQVYFTDFGLALSERFDLSPEERDFLGRHWDYDRLTVVAQVDERGDTALFMKDFHRRLIRESKRTPFTPPPEAGRGREG
ncbi:protein kinase family protein [Nonomuraea soli]|uniref:Protein kinase domain-containing protein n=1 Tax=Nonomuraea soli TaxID=1032476 RepID=A0A7W0CQ02_9ACTN|nr:protein kinase family protein [Nonomuraea soli]MBA2894965.1 hypothetical protein [Nonomuraea soli]